MEAARFVLGAQTISDKGVGLVTDGFVSAEEALRRVRASQPNNRFPGRKDPRTRSGLLFPGVTPSFKITAGEKVFTVGSCFARNAEEYLTQFEVPTLDFAVPVSEFPGRANGLLNEYTPTAIARRLQWCLDGFDSTGFGDTLVGSPDRCVDLCLATGMPVTHRRALERRREVDALYRSLLSSDVLILTLGYIETWFDSLTQVYLSRHPPPQLMRREPDRFVFRQLDQSTCLGQLEPVMDRLMEVGPGRVIVTVSPVPLQTTFSGMDCVTANGLSKSTLLCVAHALARRYPGRVDYFPSYDIVMSGGRRSFWFDQVHVRSSVVRRIVRELCVTYGVDPAAQHLRSPTRMRWDAALRVVERYKLRRHARDRGA